MADNTAAGEHSVPAEPREVDTLGGPTAKAEGTEYIFVSQVGKEVAGALEEPVRAPERLAAGAGPEAPSGADSGGQRS